MNTIHIGTIIPEQWQQYRDLRLQALKEESQAFGSTYEENVNHSDSYWKKRIEDTYTTHTQWLLFAIQDTTLVGMVGAFVNKEHDVAEVIAMYVIPQARGKGISKLLMQELLHRIQENPAIKKVTVQVNMEQEAAFQLYLHAGFTIVKQYSMKLGDGKEHEACQLQYNF